MQKKWATDLSPEIRAVQKFCEERDWDQYHSAKDLAIGLVTEASELLEHFRFLDPGQVNDLLTKENARHEIADELADVFFFLLRFSQRNDFDLISALYRKLAKNEEKYPVAKSRGNNIKYTHLK